MQLCQMTFFLRSQKIWDLVVWLRAFFRKNMGSYEWYLIIWGQPKVLTLKLPLPQLMVDTIFGLCVFVLMVIFQKHFVFLKCVSFFCTRFYETIHSLKR